MYEQSASSQVSLSMIANASYVEMVLIYVIRYISFFIYDSEHWESTRCTDKKITRPIDSAVFVILQYTVHLQEARSDAYLSGETMWVQGTS